MSSTRYLYLIFSNWSPVNWCNSRMAETMIVLMVINIITINRHESGFKRSEVKTKLTKYNEINQYRVVSHSMSTHLDTFQPIR